MTLKKTYLRLFKDILTSTRYRYLHTYGTYYICTGTYTYFLMTFYKNIIFNFDFFFDIIFPSFFCLVLNMLRCPYFFIFRILGLVNGNIWTPSSVLLYRTVLISNDRFRVFSFVRIHRSEQITWIRC